MTQGSGGGTAVSRNPAGPGGGGTVARTGSGDVYAGRDGNVYKNEGGSWQKYDNGELEQRSAADATAEGPGQDPGAGTRGPDGRGFADRSPHGTGFRRGVTDR